MNRFACTAVGTILGALVVGQTLRAQPEHAAAPDTAALLSQLRENVHLHRQHAQSLVALHDAGRISSRVLHEAEIAAADAEALVARVTGDPEPRLAAERLRIALYEQLLEDARLRPDETNAQDQLELLRQLSEARVRLWELQSDR